MYICVCVCALNLCTKHKHILFGARLPLHRSLAAGLTAKEHQRLRKHGEHGRPDRVKWQLLKKESKIMGPPAGNREHSVRKPTMN